MDASSAFKDSLPTTPEALMDRLSAAGISFSRHEHPPLRTVEDSKAFRGEMDGTHVKNLYLRDRKKRNFLVVAQEDRDIDLKALPDRIGSDRLSFGSADRLFEFLGVRPGAVSPFTLINDTDHRITLALDASLMEAEMLFFHPLVNDLTLGVTPDGLRRFLAISGHDPMIITL
ncbi:MAG: prolyl-tRNA synthetase associated domain-containing protein [Candidatus Puniceispirillaceae bacterium]